MNALPAAREDLVIRELDEEVIVFDPATSNAHTLNPTAAAILLLCDGSRDGDEIAREVARTFSIDEARANADVAKTLQELRDRGLIEPCPAH
ncbi:MAG: HPr-rel-A system PqqD family peptide chaperone [Planctomycetes bacterium]|nr:HPr-rel-A system PqqD family peptide chaperone [Planctomycetota bacterium]